MWVWMLGSMAWASGVEIVVGGPGEVVVRASTDPVHIASCRGVLWELLPCKIARAATGKALTEVPPAINLSASLSLKSACMTPSTCSILVFEVKGRRRLRRVPRLRYALGRWRKAYSQGEFSSSTVISARSSALASLHRKRT